MEKFSEITEENLRVFLTAFYSDVQKDDLIGPIFTNRIGTSEEDWAPHMDKVVAFWSSIFLKTNTYRGKMVLTHNAINGLETQHFKRWMEIFMPCVNRYYAVNPACDLMIKAQTMLKTLHQGYRAKLRRQSEKSNLIEVQ